MTDVVRNESGRANGDRVNILVVDDSPEKLVAVKALLEELGEEVVTAISGREALRQLLHREFAVILLDINMPGMDGFETAALIRQRRRSEHIPIIFLTGYADETHTARGYSLGAVDYIITPVDPEVVRSKVAVFVELFRKTEQVKRQAESLRRRNEQLHRLAEVSLAINSARSVDDIFERVSTAARQLTGALAAVAVTQLEPERDGAAHVACSVSDDLLSRAPEVVAQARALSQALGAARGVHHLDAAALASESRWREVRDTAELASPSGWLSAPLVGHEGRAMGWVHVAHRERGGFGAGDQAALQQLAQVASIAVENTLFAEARESNRLKDEFLTVLSHELRTPLTAIVGWTSILRASQYDATRFGRGLEIIERNVAAQTKLIDDLLDISRIIAGKLRLSLGAVEIASLVEGVVEAMRPAAEGKGLELGLRVAPELPPGLTLAGDAERLQQVAWNLLSNAIKFTPPGGRVEVCVGGGAEAVELEVRDTGRGIDPSFIAHVFERFRQDETSTIRTHGGLGLGLAIVRHLVEQHGGRVWAESAGVGEGASFYVRLPVTAAPPAIVPAPPPRRAPSATATLTGRHVLLVDDEQDTRDLVVEVLAGAGATVTAAASVREAKELLERARFDLVVSDIAMPLEDGYALVRWIRGHGSHGRLPALALSAYARSEDRQRALQAGFDGYLAKPVAPVELLAAAGAVLAPRRAARDARPPRNGRRVLVVENDAAAREALTALLERRGHRVTAAESGVEGVEKAAALRPDVAIVDLGLPDLDGLEVARRLRAGGSASATLVAVTGRTVDSDVEAALAAGFDAHLAKPLDLERLYELIDAAALAQ